MEIIIECGKIILDSWDYRDNWDFWDKGNAVSFNYPKNPNNLNNPKYLKYFKFIVI